MEIVNTLYEQLNRKLKITKYDYSRDWLKKSKGYLAYIQSSKNTASLDDFICVIWTSNKTKNDVGRRRKEQKRKC